MTLSNKNISYFIVPEGHPSQCNNAAHGCVLTVLGQQWSYIVQSSTQSISGFDI